MTFGLQLEEIFRRAFEGKGREGKGREGNPIDEGVRRVFADKVAKV
jgi:hypothetical protein